MTNCSGTIRIYCFDGSCPIKSAWVLLIDSCDKITDKKTINHCGYADLNFCKTDVYQIRIITSNEYTPLAQTRWAKLINRCKYSCTFKFSSIYQCHKTGKLVIHLFDTNYPLKKIDKGEYTLWLGLK